MPAKKKYFSDEERLLAERESYRRYNNSEKGIKRNTEYNSTDKYCPDKQREYQKRHLDNLSATKKEERRQSDLERYKKSRIEDLPRHMVNAARKRAKDKGIEFSITKEDVIIPDFCPILNIKLAAGIGKRIPSSPSLDRFDNKVGYTKENTRVISLRANVLKNDAELWEMRSIVKYMEGN
jgi:hypothetical protein